MDRSQERPLIPELARSGRPHVRLSSVGLEALKEFESRLQEDAYELRDAGCLCGEREHAILVAEEDRYGLPIKTLLCQSCGLLYSSPRMSLRGATKFYENDYRLIYRGKQKPTESFFEDQARHGRQIKKRVFRYLAPISDCKVFDIGCGAGGTLMPFFDAGFECRGCDFGADYLERGRKAGLTLEIGDYRALEIFAPAGLIIASHVLEHCLDPVEELKGWSSLLADDGLLYIEVPGLFDVYRNYRSLAGFFHVAHPWVFTLDTLTEVAAKAGLRRLSGNEEVWAVFRLGTPSQRPNCRTSKIERFLASGNSGGLRLLRNFRRHSLRLWRGAVKRLRFGQK